jgi:transcriptional regulator with XRE-family HTH domain
MTEEKTNPNYVRLRHVLVESRTKAGVTQTELAALLGKPQSYVSKIESGERGIDVVEFVDYVKAIGADPVHVLRRVLQKG